MLVSLHFFVKATKIYQFKGKNYKAKDYKMCLGNLSKDFTIDNMKKKKKEKRKNRIKRRIFAVKFYPIDTRDILDVQIYI